MSEYAEFTGGPDKRRDFLHRFSNPWIGLMGTIFTVKTK
jgi:hypothetical protein